MALTYAFLFCVIVTSVVYARSVSESDANESGRSDISVVTRVKRSVVSGRAVCSAGEFRRGGKCHTCKEYGRKIGRPMKNCHGKCIDNHRRCSRHRRRMSYA